VATTLTIPMVVLSLAHICNRARTNRNSEVKADSAGTLISRSIRISYSRRSSFIPSYEVIKSRLDGGVNGEDPIEHGQLEDSASLWLHP